MTVEIQRAEVQQTRCALVFDAASIEKPAANWLSQGVIQSADTVQRVTNGGRGSAWFLQLGDISAVLREYRRGGLVSRINQQTYVGLSRENSRAFQEWALLAKMYVMELPVPRPLAASMCRWPCSSSPFYRAHILVERLANVETLDQLLSQIELSADQWQVIGETIARFHAMNVYHADLNANNILIDQQGKVFLIDFDKSEIRPAASGRKEGWKDSNLQRLKRSLYKQQGLHEKYHFSEANWQQLEQSYRAATNVDTF